MVDILVLVDHDEGNPGKVSTQLLTAARQRGDGAVHAALFGSGAAGAAERLGTFGVEKAYVWESPAADEYATEPQVAALVAALQASGAPVLLYPADPFIGDVAARAAVRAQAGIITDAADVELDGDAMIATKEIFGGEMTSQCRVRGDRPQFLGVKPNAFTAEEVGGSPAEVVELDVELDEKAMRAQIVEVVDEAAGGRPEMSEAAVVVAGGRGLGSAEGFRYVEQLADALGGAVGASRAATDAGWYPHQHQIGQTGKTVAPQLYIGVGISGAIQHRAGMQTSQTIVAVNKDAEAPALSISDFAVIGDLYKVVPALIEEIEQRRQ